MKAYFCDRYTLPTAPGSRFPVTKYARLRERVAAIPDLAIELVESPRLGETELELAHTPAYVRRVLAGELSDEEQRLLGFPWTAELVERARRSAGGTLAACRAAMVAGVAVNLAGGTHHATADRGAGYCVFNDVAIAARALNRFHGIDRVLIVDADVHQGDGTAQILADDASLYTYSIHGERNFPRRKATSNLDIALPDDTGDAVYLRNFRDGLRRALLAARPGFVIYLAGADPYTDDRLGRLRVSKAGLRARDEVMFGQLRLRELPAAVVMGGGYAADVEDIVDIHAATVTVAAIHASTRAPAAAVRERHLE